MQSFKDSQISSIRGLYKYFLFWGKFTEPFETITSEMCKLKIWFDRNKL